MLIMMIEQYIIFHPQRNLIEITLNNYKGKSQELMIAFFYISEESRKKSISIYRTLLLLSVQAGIILIC